MARQVLRELTPEHPNCEGRGSARLTFAIIRLFLLEYIKMTRRTAFR